MKIVLLKNIKNLGNEGDIVDVKNGYAKNHLFPKELALLAIKNNIDNIKRNKNIDNANLRSNEICKLDNTSILIPIKVKENDEIYGSINTKSLDKIFKKLNIPLNIKHLESEVLIKKIGKYKLIFNNKKYGITTTIYIVLIERR